MSITLSVKVSDDFAKQYRSFCEENCLQIGRFTERVLLEAMEDHYFGRKAQSVLSRTTGTPVPHEEAFGKDD
jgi:hypothetical protein